MARAVLLEKSSSGVEDRVEGELRPLLARGISRCRAPIVFDTL